MPNHGDWQLGIYLAGLEGVRPELPMDFAELARRAEEAMSPRDLVVRRRRRGRRDTQDANVRAFARYGLMPRMLTGAAQRDVSVDLFGQTLPTPLMFAPVGVIGLCADDGHGDLATARAASATGVPMIASTLSQDPLEDVAAALGETPGWFQLYPPNDRELTESLVHRAEAAGFRAIVITLDTLTLGWRPRDLPSPASRSSRDCAWPTTSPTRSSARRLAAPPEDDVEAATGLWAMIFGNQSLTWDDLAWLRSLTDPADPAQGDLLPRRRTPRGRRRDERDLLLQPRRPAGQRWTARAGLPDRRRRRRRRRSRSSSTPGSAAAPTCSRPSRSARRAVAHRPPVRLRARGRRAGRHRARRTVPARRARPDHGHRRLPEPRRAHAGSGAAGSQVTHRIRPLAY